MRPLATNDVTFQVDMTYQVVLGNFDPATGTVELRGGFNNWGTPQIVCTNDPAAPNTNLYKAVVRLSDGVGALEYYKFWASVPNNSGWETMANNRPVSIVRALLKSCRRFTSATSSLTRMTTCRPIRS